MVYNVNTALGRCRMLRISSPRYIVNVRGQTVAELDTDLALIDYMSHLSADDVVCARVLYVDSVRAVCPCGNDDFGRGRVAVPVLVGKSKN